MWFLCVLFHRLLDYRRPEVESLAELFGTFGKDEGENSSGNRHLQWKLPENHHIDSPFHFVCLPSEEIARNIANRSILVKGIYELWGQGSSQEDLEEAIKCFPDERKLPYLASDSTFRIIVDSFGKVISFQEENERIQGLIHLPFKFPNCEDVIGCVGVSVFNVPLEGKGYMAVSDQLLRLQGASYGSSHLSAFMTSARATSEVSGIMCTHLSFMPDHKFWLMETDNYGSNNGLPPVVQKRIFFGREVGAGDRKLLPTYQLKSRNYLGLTAMDAEMAFLMANQGLAQPGKLVYDPFVGTGSILIAAAHFGAMTMGADIDIRVIRDGRGPDRNVWSNFKQYGLPMPISLLRADNNLPPWHTGLKEVFDAIIWDPPYGVQAGGRKLLKGIVGPYTIPEGKKTDHMPSTALYCLAECMHDLLDLSAKMLIMGGRLVFFFPVVREDGYTDAHFPEHPCSTLIGDRFLRTDS